MSSQSKRGLENAQGQPGAKKMRMGADTEREIAEFQDFLRIKSISFEGPQGTYQECADMLGGLCSEFGEVQVKTYVEGKPIVIVTIAGKNPELKALLLNGHYDVVPVEQDKWNYDPWAATMADNGNIYARGTQDMKCVCMQYIHALRRMKADGLLPFERTLHLSFVPDEEIGGFEGMEKMVEDSDLMAQLNIGFALDEGLANPDNAYTVFYGERTIHWMRVKAIGPTGHGSRFVENTATIKLIECVNEFLKFRSEQEKILKHKGHSHSHDCTKKTLGDVTTVNLTMLKAGVTPDGGKNYNLNVIPTTAEAGFDVRISPQMPMEKWNALVEKWTAHPDISIDYVHKQTKHLVSTIDPEDPWWSCFSSSMQSLGVELQTEIFPAGTDSAKLREHGIPSYGFSPMKNTPILLHDNDEFLNRDVYLEGIQVYEKLLPTMCNLAKHSKD